jgi:hypothetical protein
LQQKRQTLYELTPFSLMRFAPNSYVPTGTLSICLLPVAAPGSSKLPMNRLQQQQQQRQQQHKYVEGKKESHLQAAQG